MTKKLFHNHLVKVATGRFPFFQKINTALIGVNFSTLLSINWLLIVFCSEILLLPFQLGRHFWPPFAFVLGERIDYLSPTLYISDIPILIAFTSLSLKGKIRPKLMFILIFSYLSVSAFISFSPLNAWYGLLKFLELAFFIYWVSGIDFKSELVSYLFIPGIIFESALCFAQYMLQKSVGGIFWFFGERTFTSSTPGIANASINGALVLRTYGTFSHPNVLAGFLLIAMIYVGSLFIGDMGKYKKIFLFLVLAIGTIALLFTLSRLAIILWCLVVIGTGLLRHYKNKKRELLLALCLSIGFVMIIVFFPHVANRFLGISLQDESLSQRIVLMQDSFAMIKKNPIFGIGLNNFLPVLPEYESYLRSQLLLQPVHNIYLLVLAETGIVGAASLFWFLARSFYHAIILFKETKILSQKKLALATIIALSVVLILGFFDHYFLTLQQGQLLLAFLLGMSWRRTMLQ